MSLMAAALLPACTASIRSAGPAAANAAILVSERTRSSVRALRILDLRHGLRAVVAHLVDFNSRALNDGQQKVRKRCLLRILEVLAAFHLAVGASDDGHRQRRMIVAIAVAHVAAPD